MKRAVAFIFYYLGLTSAVGIVLVSARTAAGWEFLLIPLFGLPVWWICAGISVRLGVFPSEFFRSLATAAGFLEPDAVKAHAADDQRAP